MKRMKEITLSCLFLFICFSISYAQPKGQNIVIGESFSIQSKVLNEERPYLIYLPDDYSPTGNPLSVMYLMDGDGHFHHTSGIVQFLKRQGNIPNMMIVGIPNTTDRTRDLTPPIEKDKEALENMPTAGGADNMLQFMREELIPHIEKNYNTNSYRVLVGHSFGGIFAVHALLTQSDLFDSYISISPSMWWDQQNLVDKAEAFLDSKPELDGFFYMTMGNEGGAMLGGAMKLAALFEEKAPKNFGWDFKPMEEETHGSIPHRSTYYGLEAIFNSWYKVDLDKMYVEGGIPAIEKHYANMSDKLGHEMKPSEGDFNNLGYRFLGNKNYDKAIEVFAENVKRFPKSANVYDSLGEGYMAKGDNESAIKYYKKSIKINPGNVNGVKILKGLGVDYNPIKEAVDLPEKEAKAYCGKYSVSAGGTLNIDFKDGKLVAWSEDTGMPTQTLASVYKNGFVAQPANILLIFEEDDSKKPTSFEAQMGPGQYVYGKLIEGNP